jgi:hypothetical protein
MDNIIINKKKIQKCGLFFDEFCFLLNFLRYSDFKQNTYENLINKGLVEFNDNKFSITKQGTSVLNNIIGADDIDEISNDEIINLSIKMSETFPHGIKPDSGKYWRGNELLVTSKLKYFIKKYRITDLNLILSATQRYVEDFSDDKKFMRILPYFIYKDGDSDLITVIENM